jgi:predicted aspartyl protease
MPDKDFMYRLALSLALIAALWPRTASAQSHQVDSATVSMRLEGNRAFVDLTFRRADGTTRVARFWIDTGGDDFVLTETLARDLGLSWRTPEQPGGKYAPVVTPLPQPFLGDLPLTVADREVAVFLGSANLLPTAAPGHADGLLPGHVLSRYQVILDYPMRSFTLARPGVIEPTGVALPMPVSKAMEFPRTEVEVAGQIYGFLLDTGASFSVVSDAVLATWGRHHPSWPRHQGAVGEARTLGAHPLETMIVPSGRWGPYRIKNIGVVSQPEGVFERYMSSQMAAPIIGSLGGNVLKSFRVELDYARQILYLSRH